MEKQYTLKALTGDVTASQKVLYEFISGYFAVANMREKAGYGDLATMYREKATDMFNELEELTKGGE